MNPLLCGTSRKLLLAALALQVAAAGAIAQSTRARERANENSRVSRDYGRNTGASWMSDDQFLAQAYGKGLAEIKLAHVAVDSSRDADVQKIGHRIINEQQRANEDLKKIAQNRNVTLPTDLSQYDQQTYERLSKLQGAEFDRAYRDHLNTEYKRTIQMFETAASRAQDSQLRSVASQYADLFGQHAQVIGITGLAGTSGNNDQYYTSGNNDQYYNSGDRAERGYVRERESAPSTGGSNPATDQNFLTAVHQISRMEIEAARLALSNSKDEQVKKMAQTILADHQRMDRDLASLASKEGITLPSTLLPVQDQALANLRRSSANDFDTVFHSLLTSSHRNSLRYFQNATSSSDPNVRNFAQKYVSQIKQHLQSAERTGTGSEK